MARNEHHCASIVAGPEPASAELLFQCYVCVLFIQTCVDAGVLWVANEHFFPAVGLVKNV